MRPLHRTGAGASGASAVPTVAVAASGAGGAEESRHNIPEGLAPFCRVEGGGVMVLVHENQVRCTTYYLLHSGMF